MGCVRKLGIGRAHGGYEAMDFVGVFESLAGLAIGAVQFNAGADINGQRFATRAYLQNAIGHVCRRESTT